ncbi:MAG: hypothetical protein K2N61_13020 [Lachnospiraceae bacterium]|nr:hypothetical protein [Lachnospiraceae bacterium]
MTELIQIYLQYKYEITFLCLLIYCIPESFSLVNIISSLLYSSGLCLTAKLAEHLIRHYWHCPSSCSVLYLKNKKEMCMESVYVKDNRKEKLTQDFKTIIDYAKMKEISYLCIKTHEIVIYNIIWYDMKNDIKIYYKLIKNLQVNETMEIKLSMGYMEIKRITDSVNRCARYEYKRCMTFKQFRNTLEKKRFFEVYIYFNY